MFPNSILEAELSRLNKQVWDFRIKNSIKKFAVLFTFFRNREKKGRIRRVGLSRLQSLFTFRSSREMDRFGLTGWRFSNFFLELKKLINLAASLHRKNQIFARLFFQGGINF